MPLIQLYNPISGDDWFDKFADYNFSDHQLVLQAIQVSDGVVIPLLAIRTTTRASLGVWALNHQSLHDATNAHFALTGSDYTHIPLDDISALQSMQELHAEEHRLWHELLGI